MNNKEKRTKISLSPDFKRHSKKLVPVRIRFPKMKIKEVPGWHQPAELQESIKVTSIRPYKVKNKRDFYSPLFFATEERQPFILESKSSSILPRLVKNNKLNWNSMKVFNKLQINLPQAQKGKVSVFFPSVLNDAQDSENNSSPMRPLFSHRSLDPPNNPEMKFLTKETSSPLVSYSKKKRRTINSKFKLPQGVSKETQYQFEESKDIEVIKRNIKTSQESRNSSVFYTKGTRIRLLTDEKRSKSVEKLKRTGQIMLVDNENTEIQEDPQKEIEELRRKLSANDEKMVKNLQGTEKTPSIIKEKDFGQEKSGKLKEGNKINYLNPESPGSNEEKNIKTSTKVPTRTIKSEKKHKNPGSISQNSEDSDMSLSSSYSESEEQGKTPENKGKTRKTSKKSKKTSEISRKSSENSNNELNSHQKKPESEGSVTFSPNLTKRETNAITATPVTKYSASPNITPAVKSPEPSKLSTENPQTRSKDSKISIKLPTQSKRPTITSPSPETQNLNSKTSKNPSSRLKNPSSTLKQSSSPNVKSHPNLKKPSKTVKNLKSSKTLKVIEHPEKPEKPEKLDPDLGAENKERESPSKNRTGDKKASGKSNFKAKSKGKSSVNASNRYDSPFSDDIKLEIRITEVPDASVLSNNTFNPEYLHTSQYNNSDEANQSRISGSSSFLHVRRNTRNPEERQRSRRVSRMRKTPISKTEKPRSSEKKRVNNKELSRKSGKINKKQVKSSENESSYSSGSDHSSFSKYSAIRKTELDQKFLGQNDSVSNKASTKAGMVYFKEFVSSEVKKKIGKLDPISNFIYNFSFSVLKSIKNLIKFKGFNNTNRNMKKKRTKWLGRIETELFDREALGKGKLKTNKKQSETKFEVPKPQNTNLKPPKVQKKAAPTNLMFYPREVTLKAMHSRNNSNEKSIKKPPEAIEKKPKPKKVRKKSVNKSSESESSIIEENPLPVNHSKKTLLYELSHQELTLQIAKQIISNNEEGNNSDSSFSETINSSDESINEIDLQNEIDELAVNLKLSPKSFAFGPEINLGLLKQNQILFNFKELEEGKFEVDFENLKRYSKKQEFLGMQKLNSEHSEAYSNYTLQIKNGDCLTEEQKYNNRMQRLRFSRKKFSKIKESLKNHETVDSSFNGKRQVIKAFSPNPMTVGADFDERVYLRLRDSKSMLSQLPHTKL